jgi:hypothetical protein
MHDYMKSPKNNSWVMDGRIYFTVSISKDRINSLEIRPTRRIYLNTREISEES